MTRPSKATKPRREPPRATRRRGLPRELVVLAGTGLVGIVIVAAYVWNGFEKNETSTVIRQDDPGPVHVHGLGINPADGSLFIATHTGLYRVAKDSRKAARVGDRHQDTMGFSIVGPNRFLGSGHPDARERELPPLLGLIESTDSGQSWRPVSLLGDADFHVLRSSGSYVYGYDASNDRLLASADAGRSWDEREKPAPIVDLAPNPSAPKRLIATVSADLGEGMYTSQDGGESWERLADEVGLLAWPTPGRLYLVDQQGTTFTSSAGGRELERRGEIGGQPAALLAAGKDELYAALHDGTIKRSTDGGRSWTVRSRPLASPGRAIEVVAGGEALLAPGLTQRLIAEYVRWPPPRVGIPGTTKVQI